MQTIRLPHRLSQVRAAVAVIIKRCVRRVAPLLLLVALSLLGVPLAGSKVQRATAQAGAYKPTDLFTLGGASSHATGINAPGQVVGYSDTAGNEQRAFLWSVSGGMQDLGTLPGLTNSYATGINDSGQVVGYSDTAGNGRAFLWSVSGGMQPLGTLSGSTTSIASGINNSTQVVGNSGGHAVLWNAGGGMTDLGTLPGGIDSFANGINNTGQVVGFGHLANSSRHAFLWDSNGMRDLSTLGGSESHAFGINDSGQVIGWSHTTAGNQHAFLWTASGRMQDLGTLPASTTSIAFGINNSTQVVGYSGGHAFLWSTSGGMIDLNTLLPPGSGWVLTNASGINANGQIVGTGTINGHDHAFLLTPQPIAAVSPSNLDFGTQLVGTTSGAQNVTVTNSGAASLTISGVSLNGPNAGDFTITANTCAGAIVAAGNSCTIGVSFAPRTAGSRTASLTIADNAGTGSQSVALSGTGTNPPTFTPVPSPSNMVAPPRPTNTTVPPPATYTPVPPTPTSKPITKVVHHLRINLRIKVSPPRVVSGGTLTVLALLGPHAQIRLALKLVTRQHNTQVVLYHIVREGQADARGQFIVHLHITYRPVRNVLALLWVSARSSNGTVPPLSVPVTIQPRPPCLVPCSVAVGRAPQAVAVDARTGHVFVANEQSNTISMLDAKTGEVLRTVSVGQSPEVLAVDAQTARVFVANYMGGTVSVLDTASGRVVRTVDVGGSPVAMAVDAQAGRALVLNGHDISVLDARTGKVQGHIGLGNYHIVGGHGNNVLGVDEGTHRVFLIDRGNSSVSVLDPRRGVVLHLSLESTPYAVAVDPQRGRVFVTIVREGKGAVSVLDAHTGKVLHMVNVGQAPEVVTMDERTHRAFVGNNSDGSVSVLDTRTETVVRTVAVETSPWAIAVDQDARRVFVTNRSSNSVSVLDAQTGQVVSTIPVGTHPEAIAVDAVTSRVFVTNRGSDSVSVLDARGGR